VNDELVYTSERVAQFPLACKVVNILKRNQRSGIGVHDWKMQLPVKNVKWVGMVSMTLSIISIGRDGVILTSCINMAGEELARVESVVGETIADLKHTLRSRNGLDVSQMCLISDDGQRLTDQQEWPIPTQGNETITLVIKVLGIAQGREAITSCSSTNGNELARVGHVVGGAIADLKVMIVKSYQGDV